MKIYQVTINEPASFTYTIESENEESAKRIAMEAHSEDLMEPEFNLSDNAEISDIIELTNK